MGYKRLAFLGVSAPQSMTDTSVSDTMFNPASCNPWHAAYKFKTAKIFNVA